MSMVETIARSRRREILRLLTQAPPQFQGSSRVLHSALVSDFAFPPSLDQVKSDLVWLAEQGLVTVEVLADNRTIMGTLTARGADVAAGRAIVPGVEAPEPPEA
jgi:hypothetical protein